MSDRSKADRMTDDGQNPYEYCAHCDDSLTDGEWHPVATDSSNGTVVAVYSFCNDACQAAWAAEQ